MVSLSYYKNTLPYSNKSGNNTKSSSHAIAKNYSIKQSINQFIKYCQAYGSIYAYYGAGFGAFISALVVAVFNEYIHIVKRNHNE